MHPDAYIVNNEDQKICSLLCAIEKEWGDSLARSKQRRKPTPAR